MGCTRGKATRCTDSAKSTQFAASSDRSTSGTGTEHARFATDPSATTAPACWWCDTLTCCQSNCHAWQIQLMSPRNLIDLKMNSEISRLLGPDPQRMRQAGRVSWLQCSWLAPVLALALALFSNEFEIKRLLREAPSAALTLRTVTLKDLEDTLGIAVGVNDITLLAFANQMLSQNVTSWTSKKF